MSRLMKKIIGYLIYPWVVYTVWKIRSSAYNPKKCQQKILKKIISSCKNTEIGKHLYLKSVKSLNDARRIPSTNYSQLKEYLDKIFEIGVKGKGILNWSEIQAFSKTSGSTGVEKIFPISRKSLAHFYRGSFAMYASLLSYLGKTTEICEGKSILLSALSYLHYSPTGLPINYMSTYLLQNLNWPSNLLILPSKKIDLSLSWPDVLENIFIEAKNEDVRLISGFPVIIKIFTESALAYYKVDHLRKIWPNLFACFYGGNQMSALEKKNISEMFVGKDNPNPLIFYENYSSVECLFGFTFRPDWPGLVFNSTEIFYQFKEYPGGLIWNQLHELEMYKKYEVYISTVSGFFNYEMGDIIEISSTSPLTFRFSGRTTEQISIRGEKLTVDLFKAAIQALEKKINLSICDFVVWIEFEKIPFLVFGICIDSSSQINDDWAITIDQFIQEKKFSYFDDRKNQLYGLPKVLFIKKSIFDEYRYRNVHRGNFKEKRIFQDFEEFEKEYFNKT